MRRLGLPNSEQPVWDYLLLAALAVQMVARPFVETMGWTDMILSALHVLVLVSCVMAMGPSRISRVVSWAVLVPASVLSTLYRGEVDAPHLIGQGLALLIILIVCWRILLRIFTVRNVTWATISGAVAVFLLLSVLWTVLYVIAAWSPALEPAFHGVPPASELLLAADQGQARAEVSSLLSYFSLVTLTSVGYGDISPSHPITRSLVTVQAVAGQLYLVVLVARLVSLHAQSTPPPES